MVFDPAGLSTGEVMFASLLADSHGVHPDDIPALVARKAALVGLDDVRMFLVDIDQRAMHPFPDIGDGESLDINATVAGRAFRTMELVATEDALWVPLLDGTDRLGVLRMVPRTQDVVTMGRAEQLAALTAHMIVSKRQYGDNFARTSRRVDVSLAAELRWAFLPPLTFMSPAVAVAGALEPAYDIAGDCFDYAVNGDTLHIAVFDAMGHELPAARLANLAKVVYRYSRRRGRTLEQTYEAIDARIAEHVGGDSFVTAHLVTLELSSGEIRWVNAGHPPPILLRRGRDHSVLTGPVSPPMGTGLGRPAVGEAQLQPGDRLLYFSDGVTDARSRDGEEFGLERLVDLLVRAAASDEPPPETVRRLTHAVLDHQPDGLDDDATLLLVVWPGR